MVLDHDNQAKGRLGEASGAHLPQVDTESYQKEPKITKKFTKLSLKTQRLTSF
jgi:hypothetical protein